MQGKQPFQKLKPYLILNYLMEESDINNPVRVSDIVAYLE